MTDRASAEGHREAIWGPEAYHPGYGKGVCAVDGEPWPCRASAEGLRAALEQWGHLRGVSIDGTDVAYLVAALRDHSDSGDIAQRLDEAHARGFREGYRTAAARATPDRADHPLVVKDGIGYCQTCGARGEVATPDRADPYNTIDPVDGGRNDR